jgi:hypothetical protein
VHSEEEDADSISSWLALLPLPSIAANSSCLWRTFTESLENKDSMPDVHESSMWLLLSVRLAIDMEDMESKDERSASELSPNDRMLALVAV